MDLNVGLKENCIVLNSGKNNSFIFNKVNELYYFNKSLVLINVVDKI